MTGGKALGSFSGIRKYLEKDMLSPSLQGRVRYGCTQFVGMDGCHIFDIWVDGRQVKRFSWETVNSYFIRQGYAQKEKPGSIRDYWEDFWALMEKYPMEARTEYTDQEFSKALKTYRSQDIQRSLLSPDPIVNMFALLDRRCGKNALRQFGKSLDTKPAWLSFFYELRWRAEETEKE